ncbi:MAG: arsenical pump-driving ATPase [Oscillospiraceae bacterium]|jgi:arsenite-transporting ATPase|uniref:arsenical pump-driving ATPase n=3 Tax=Clostridia TaxID=186801 RepID=UPI00189BBDA8|nr:MULTISPECIES: arsenical pump-driving ATPase [Oscillospiraceae]MBE6035841.1 arsenical pump-driving ATPase [Clostridiales bacterium]MDD4715772.1 arsenical pump-driving ATPase [Oscillospiraceae bacterium]HWQ74824.1 arsenical pump-driving ATPase [Syntrophomonas sp.]
MKLFDPSNIRLTKYLFYTGKGGVGKTSVACATAVSLADNGKKVLLISTDPASNLQDVFSMELTNKGVPISDVPNLVVANLDPIQAAAEYRENVIAPYRGKLPTSVIANMEEQLSGSCTIEIAAFNEFSSFITDDKVQQEYDHIIFDTAPTGHTLRMLQLPSAWSNFISESTHGASCLGQLSGLESKKAIYKQAVETLADGNLTTLILVTRPEIAPFKEAERASSELSALGVGNQTLVINGILMEHSDALSSSLYEKQQAALAAMPESLWTFPRYMVPLRAYNITGLENVRALLHTDHVTAHAQTLNAAHIHTLNNVIDELAMEGKRVIFTMGKGGVGKTTVAAAVALGIAKRGRKVHLTTTDPAAHLKFVLDETSGVSMSHIDEAEELKKYQSEVLSKARASGMGDEDIAYVEEDLRSPCTQEIAVFRAFAEIVEKADDQVVVIDTAPTGHTLLLLESTQSYNHEIERTKGEIPEAVKRLLPRLKSNETEVIIVTLPEATPVYEALRLEDDLQRAGIAAKWWVVNQSLYGTNTTNPILAAKAAGEVEWLNRIDEHAGGKFALIAWSAGEIKGNNLLTL